MHRPDQTQSIRGDSTRERLLDPPDKLMAATGTVGMSLRDITSRANTNLAAVNYHFGSKEVLVKAAVRRTAACIEYDERSGPKSAISVW
jgi:AcrR family transcriptional regulator